jgi:hypothetical protein
MYKYHETLRLLVVVGEEKHLGTVEGMAWGLSVFHVVGENED